MQQPIFPQVGSGTTSKSGYLRIRKNEYSSKENQKSTELSLEDQVIYGSLTTLAREVGHRLKRAAYSSLIRESDDYGAAIVSQNFELLAEAETTPLQMGPLAGYCRGVMETLAASGETLNPGGIYLHNDPYSGATHSPDIGAIAPLFIGDELFGFVGTASPPCRYRRSCPRNLYHQRPTTPSVKASACGLFRLSLTISRSLRPGG